MYRMSPSEVSTLDFPPMYRVCRETTRASLFLSPPPRPPTPFRKKRTAERKDRSSNLDPPLAIALGRVRQVESEISCDKSSRIVLRDEHSPCKQSLDRYDLACREIYPVRENRISSGTRRVKFPRRDSLETRGHGYRHPLRIPVGSEAIDPAGRHRAARVSHFCRSLVDFQRSHWGKRIPRRPKDKKNRPIGSAFFLARRRDRVRIVAKLFVPRKEISFESSV